MTKRQLDIVEMIDWYDGIVQAVVSTNWIEGEYLCSMIAFDADLKKRVLALLPLHADELSEIRLRLNGDWETLLLYLRQLWFKANGVILILCYEDLKEQVIAEAKVMASKLNHHAILEPEQAITKGKMRWFDMF